MLIHMAPSRFSRLRLAVVAAAALPAAAHAGFADRTVAAGVEDYLFTWGAAFIDVDRDEDLDLYVGHHTFLPELFWNDGSGTFDLDTYPQPWGLGPYDRHGIVPLPLGDDEFPDLFVTHGAEGGAGGEENEVFRNDGGGSLVHIEGTGLDGLTGRNRATSAADYDGDLRVDVWIGKAPGANPNSLFKNVATYSFVDVAPAVGLDEGEGTVGGIWGDYDLDGDPDLFVGGEEFSRPSKLFRNDGGTFTDATAIFSPPPPIVSGADWGDFDEDGDLDLALCDGQVGLFDTFVEGDTLRYFFNTRWNENGIDGLTVPSNADTAWARLEIRGFQDVLFVFLGPNEVNPPLGTWIVLTDALVGEPVIEPGVDRGTWVWRQYPGGPWEIRCPTPLFNADAFNGLVREGSPISGVVGHDFEDENFVPGGPRVFRNDGGAFAEVTASVGLPDAMLNPRDLSWVDFDNDGDLDLHVVDMGTSELPNAPDALFRNDGGTFVDVAATEGALGGTAGMGDGAVWGDVDRDGDLDVFVAQGAGPRALGGHGPSLFYRNDGGGSSVTLDLVGSISGPAPIGAKVTARIGGRTLVRWLAANSWRGFADPVEIHLGLGAAAAVDSLTIAWPSGIVQVLVDVAPGFYRVAESPTVDAPAIAPAGAGWRIEAVRPQPARGVQAIVVAAGGPVRLEIAVFDAGGRRVRTLHRGPVEAGAHTFEWDGRDDGGAPVAPGVYFFRVDDGRAPAFGKSVRLR
jgi:hypothetical protein